VRSLRGQLAAFWVILATVCVSLGAVTVTLFRSSSSIQIEAVQEVAEQSCRTIAERYAKSISNASSESPQLDLLQVLLQLVLVETPHVEGGAWNGRGGFIAYAYPTYEGSGVKRDVPDAEKSHIAEIAQVAARTQRLQTDVVRASREALVLSACPLRSPGNDLVAWTMARTSLSALDTELNLRVTLGALLLFVLASGLWLGAILLRGYRQVRLLENRLARHDAAGDGISLNSTGIAELDRLVTAFNRYSSRFDETRASLQNAERARARDQRLAALGRMTGSVAHEIRNPIAAMRLKAENALSGPVEKQSDALHSILEQIARLDGLVQSLLAVVQPINLTVQTLDIARWVQERVEAVRSVANARGVTLEVRATSVVAAIDPIHLGRAVDNLIDNAVRHARGNVVVSLERPRSGTLEIAVQDDGDGVDKALRDHVFEPFASGRPEGTGLGLALSREVALAHGGNLVLEGSPAGGALFVLEFPWRAS
jgi:signal transduction histidine kinase